MFDWPAHLTPPLFLVMFDVFIPGSDQWV